MQVFDFFQAFLILVGACFTAGCVGAAFTFGVVFVCQRMRFTPLNVEINLNDYRPIE